MKTIYVLRKSFMIFFASILLGCGGDGGGAGTTFVPAFNATWPVANDADYFIDLQPDNDNRNVVSGVFEGEEIHNSDNDRNGNLIKGSFNQLNIEFTIFRPGGNIQYKGKMTPISDTDHTIIRFDLNSSEGTLVLQ